MKKNNDVPYLSEALGVLTFFLLCAVIVSLSHHVIDVKDITPLHSTQPTMECITAFDNYRTDAYELVDDNKTLITSYGRVYHVEECSLVNDN